VALEPPAPLRLGAPASTGAARAQAIARAHYASLWRLLRRLGVPEASVEDAAQQVLSVVARRIDGVDPGHEKTFLFGVALRVARAARRQWQKQSQVTVDDDALAELPAPQPDAGDALDERRARRVLDAILEALPHELRTVFVLYEIEEMTMADIARTLDVPAGTVASRLRRAREAFEVQSRRVRARLAAKTPEGRLGSRTLEESGPGRDRGCR
jgi:RNA polymerase sigma-70 factor (ECF subfamily)